MDSWASRVARHLAGGADASEAKRGRRLPRVAVALLLGALVFMTIWGFGRAAFPAASGGWRAAGLAAAVVTIAIRTLPPRPR